MSLAGISDVVFWLPEYFLSVPYLFESKDHVRKVYDGEIGKNINEIMLAKKGLRTLAIMNRGARQVSSNRKIEHPSDMEGLHLRMPENPLEAITNSKFYEVQKFIILTGHVRDVNKIQISEKHGSA